MNNIFKGGKFRPFLYYVPQLMDLITSIEYFIENMVQLKSCSKSSLNNLHIIYHAGNNF